MKSLLPFGSDILQCIKIKKRTYGKMSDVIELKILINRVLLPRIRQLEEEVTSLRKHTWPYVQGKKEAHQLHDIRMKADFLKHLDDDTIVELLRIKAELSGKSGFITREYDSIHNNFC